MKPVRVVYCVPSDVVPNLAYQAAITYAMLDLQKWFAGQLGGRTFTIFSPKVETFHLLDTAEFYSTDSLFRVLDPVHRSFPDFDDFIWVLFADVLHACDAPGRLGVTTQGVCVLPRQDMDALCGRPYFDDCGKPYGSTINQAIGGPGHEVGHALGLDHPPGCGTADESQCDWGALMYLGFHGYPDCHLTEADKAALLQHPSFAKEVNPIMKDEEFPGYKEIDFSKPELRDMELDFKFSVVDGELDCDVIDNAKGARIDFTKDEGREWLWHFRAEGGKLLARSFDKERT